jgi:hypothetical protein
MASIGGELLVGVELSVTLRSSPNLSFACVAIPLQGFVPEGVFPMPVPAASVGVNCRVTTHEPPHALGQSASDEANNGPLVQDDPDPRRCVA